MYIVCPTKLDDFWKITRPLIEKYCSILRIIELLKLLKIKEFVQFFLSFKKNIYFLASIISIIFKYHTIYLKTNIICPEG